MVTFTTLQKLGLCTVVKRGSYLTSDYHNRNHKIIFSHDQKWKWSSWKSINLDHQKKKTNSFSVVSLMFANILQVLQKPCYGIIKIKIELNTVAYTRHKCIRILNIFNNFTIYNLNMIWKWLFNLGYLIHLLSTMKRKINKLHKLNECLFHVYKRSFLVSENMYISDFVLSFMPFPKHLIVCQF